MTATVRRPTAVLPDLFSFLDNVWPFTDVGSIRVESHADEDRFVLRAELPGVDPDKDVEITVEHGRLTVSARREHHMEARYSEFHYGSFGRSVLLPVGARVEDITATYQDGILEVMVPVDTVGKEKATKIEITSGKDTKKKQAREMVAGVDAAPSTPDRPSHEPIAEMANRRMLSCMYY